MCGDTGYDCDINKTVFDTVGIEIDSISKQTMLCTILTALFSVVFAFDKQHLNTRFCVSHMKFCDIT